MRRRQKLPKIWLMTDERLGEGLFAAIGRLPRGSGIVFRHHRLDLRARRALFRRVRQAARRGDHCLLLGGAARLAAAWGADGSHGRGPGRGLRSAPVHDLRELRHALRDGADFIFLSPLFPTRSHPGAPALGRCLFAQLARRSTVPVIALGGIRGRAARTLDVLGAYGWAAIDAWNAELPA